MKRCSKLATHTHAHTAKSIERCPAMSSDVHKRNRLPEGKVQRCSRPLLAVQSGEEISWPKGLHCALILMNRRSGSDMRLICFSSYKIQLIFSACFLDVDRLQIKTFGLFRRSLQSSESEHFRRWSSKTRKRLGGERTSGETQSVASRPAYRLRAACTARVIQLNILDWSFQSYANLGLTSGESRGLWWPALPVSQYLMSSPMNLNKMRPAIACSNGPGSVESAVHLHQKTSAQDSTVKSRRSSTVSVWLLWSLGINCSSSGQITRWGLFGQVRSLSKSVRFAKCECTAWKPSVHCTSGGRPFFNFSQALPFERSSF